MNNDLPVPVEEHPPSAPSRTDLAEWSVDDLLGHVAKIRQVMKRAMVKDTHYGIIPGTDKPTIYQPGSQLLALMFRLHPEFTVTETRDGDHLECVSTCVLTHIPSGRRMGSGIGSCSSKETRYAWRNANRKCPKCGKEAIIKGKAEYGGGFVCFKKKDGCGAKFGDNDKSITDQPAGRVPNPDLADCWNAIRKLANKRSMATAILNATGASDVFTCDLEDFAEPPVEYAEPAPKPSVPKTQAPPARQTIIDVEAERAPPAEDHGEPPMVEKGDGMPSELREILDRIEKAKDRRELAVIAVDAGGLEDSLRGQARLAYTAKLDALKAGGK